ncbi:DUF5343 domain-containing protein [Mesorhizobium sp.]|uniref:DUF5343 domain-containing protein n=1 Tax=Mesorhizobium sp. TaxID=1871066 RepID=UPI0025796466|nr:DUF5343 domain-containing protein [Mesorhizobium sp.]
MSLVANGRVQEFFKRIQDGQAPDQFTIQLLKDWGFGSSNDRAYIPLLKALGFLSPDGKPTSRYHAYRDHSRSKQVMAEAIREAYSDIFLIKENPGTGDKTAINGKFKSYHNASDNTASLMTKTFLSLAELADFKGSTQIKSSVVNHKEPEKASFESPPLPTNGTPKDLSLNYNIQVHLPATKDVEVYNAIFKSIKEHLIDH